MNNRAHDDAINSLEWSGDYWRGAIEFLGSALPLTIEFDTCDPTDDDRRLAMESFKQTLPLLNEAWERQARSNAATEVVEAACSQSDASPNADDIHHLADEMQLKSLSFVYLDDEGAVFPCLAYSCPKSFPDMSLCIQFSVDLTIDEVTLNE